MAQNKEVVQNKEVAQNKQTKGLKRNPIDKYYTKPDIAEQCISAFKDNITISPNDYIIEPSAGNGAFIPGIKSLTQKYYFYDLEPANDEIIKKDYLRGDYSDVGQNIHTIGNPPFGRQSSLAIQFIKLSCKFSKSVSFILPKSFKKDSLKKAFPLNFHLIYEMDIPDNSFLVDGLEHNVPCVFQIWIKKAHNRTEIETIEPTQFRFVKKTEGPDISVRRVGVNAGAINTNTDQSIQSHYFIKFTNQKSTEDNILQLKKITYEFNNTVGPRSISKQELIKEFIKVL
jgi:hypothetical protein